MNSFISSLYVLLDVIKAFGPVLASSFLGWVAYNQFKLAKSQSKISQEQLALAKQQADIAQRKVALDIRDKKHEVFKRWNEAYYNVLHAVTVKDVLDYSISLQLFLSVSDELRFIFSPHEGFSEKRISIISGFQKILRLKRDFYILKAKLRQSGTDIEYEKEQFYYSEIREITD